MPKSGEIKNITGKRFGRLIALEHVDFTESRNAVWKCICDCGKVKRISEGKLVGKETLSCGCLRLERVHESKALPKGVAGFNNLFRSYKNSAKARNLSFDLTKEVFKMFVTDNCYYCGIKPNMVMRNAGDKTTHSKFIYNGIDRITSDLGYVLGNVLTACKRCNYAKGKMSTGEFIAMVKEITEYQNGKTNGQRS